MLLSDGETTDGRPNDDAAAEAKARGIAVNTVAFGTDSGTIEDPLTGVQVPVPVNEAALADLARATGGQSLQAETADELATVYQDLGRNLQVDVQRQRGDRLVCRSIVAAARSSPPRVRCSGSAACPDRPPGVAEPVRGGRRRRACHTATTFDRTFPAADRSTRTRHRILTTPGDVSDPVTTGHPGQRDTDANCMT